MRIGLVIPMWKRPKVAELCMRITLKNLRERFEVVPVAVCSEKGSEVIAKKLGFKVIKCVNSPLSNKFNAGFEYFKGADIDAVVQSGSDNILSLGYVDFIYDRIDEGVECISAKSCLFYEAKEKDLMYAGHFHCDVGATFTYGLLKRVQFKPYPDDLDNVLVLGLKNRTFAIARLWRVIPNVLRFNCAILDIKSSVNMYSMRRMKRLVSTESLPVEATFSKYFGDILNEIDDLGIT